MIYKSFGASRQPPEGETERCEDPVPERQREVVSEHDSPCPFGGDGRPTGRLLFWVGSRVTGRPRYRTHVYVDGYNLYYAVLRSSRHKWLDVGKYFWQLLQHDDVAVVRYFTAYARGDAAKRQRRYLTALEATASCQIILGKYKRTKVQCGVVACTYKGRRYFRKPEEKRTDVNIAVWMLRDAFAGQCDRQVLVTGDSDLVPALEAIRSVFPAINTRVYVPTPDETDERAAGELRSKAHDNRNLPLAELKKAQLPNPVVRADGVEIRKPESWT